MGKTREIANLSEKIAFEYGNEAYHWIKATEFPDDLDKAYAGFEHFEYRFTHKATKEGSYKDDLDTIYDPESMVMGKALKNFMEIMAKAILNSRKYPLFDQKTQQTSMAGIITPAKAVLVYIGRKPIMITEERASKNTSYSGIRIRIHCWARLEEPATGETHE